MKKQYIDYLNTFKNLDLITDIFLPNEAQHKQFPGNVISNIAIDFNNLPKLEKLYRFYMQKSKNGTGREKMNLYLIDHIFPSIKKELGKKNND